MNRLGPRIAVLVLGLTHSHHRHPGIHVLVHQGLGDLVDALAFLLSALQILVHHVAVGRAGAVHATEGHHARRHRGGQVGAPGGDGDGGSRRGRHGVLEKAAHLVGEHLLLGLRGNAALKEHEHGVAEGVAFLGQIAQVVAAHHRLLPGLVGKRGLAFEKRISAHVEAPDSLACQRSVFVQCSAEPAPRGRLPVTRAAAVGAAAAHAAGNPDHQHLGRVVAGIVEGVLDRSVRIHAVAHLQS